MLDVLATNNFGDTRSGGLAGPMGLFIILLLGVATVLLIRNMNSRLRRLPERFPGAEGDDASGDRGPAAGGAATTRADAPGPATGGTACGDSDRPGGVDAGNA